MGACVWCLGVSGVARLGPARVCVRKGVPGPQPNRNILYFIRGSRRVRSLSPAPVLARRSGGVLLRASPPRGVFRCGTDLAGGTRTCFDEPAKRRMRYRLWLLPAIAAALRLQPLPLRPQPIAALPSQRRAAANPPVMLAAADVATVLGYVVATGSLLLYTPIALRIVRTGSADGLTLSTWWLKLGSYTCSDLYCYSNGYPVSAYAETLVITLEAACILGLVAAYQDRLDAGFLAGAGTFLAVAGTAAAGGAPAEALALAQAGSTVLNTAALLPQLALNAERGSPGGCSIRLFTTVQLTSGDPLLLAGYGLGLALNAAVLAQIFYYGAVVQGQPLAALMTADFRSDDAAVKESGAAGGRR